MAAHRTGPTAWLRFAPPCGGAGTLRPEDPLPSVRDLAAQLVVNPRTVSQAYGELERQGVVYVRRGQGAFVSADARPDREERRALAREVARRALREAWRNGVGMEELVKCCRARLLMVR